MEKSGKKGGEKGVFSHVWYERKEDGKWGGVLFFPSPLNLIPPN